MRALLVIDAQKTIVDFKDFHQEIGMIETMITDFKENGDQVIFIRNLDDDEKSSFHKNSAGSEIHDSLKKYAEIVVEKKTPSSFYQTELDEKLKQFGVDHIFITGFNTEFCCQFTAIAAYDRGYKVTFIEDATGTVNDGTTYEMEGLDIRDFVGTVLHWSSVIEVLDYEEYVEEYRTNKV
ncbi:isochorismatase family protein [Oceanobacillus luteolus]|uniref:Isochorismatase family protein n=1 Tax=Oceanobacillus luteolus TaxID=1274358 RepID=A0ABW4HTU2_9BACI|nr:isochorismatase family protein [Oceanobacillus luteolus]MCM3741428.1 isochorismatase family protein [Oceanobacillus luteolus]